MLLNLSDISDEPLQKQISRQIRAKILSGELQAGQILPSIRVLAREQHISVITVQRGYENLEQEGLIHSRRRRGYFVSEIRDEMKKTMAIRNLTEKIKPLLDGALAEGLTAEEIMRKIKTLMEMKS